MLKYNKTKCNNKLKQNITYAYAWKKESYVMNVLYKLVKFVIRSFTAVIYSKRHTNPVDTTHCK